MRCDRLKVRALIELGDFIGAQPLAHVLRMRHRLHPFRIDAVHLLHQRQDLGEIARIAGYVLLIDLQTRQVRDLFYVFRLQ